VLPPREGATLPGTTGPYRFTRRVGRAGVARSGWRGILLGRLIPGLRIATPIAAGVFGMPFREFLPAVAVGGLLYIGIFDRVGYAVGPAALALFERVALPLGALVSPVTVARSAALALLPLALTLLLALPLAGRGLLPLATRHGEALVAVEVVRWLAFGVALGESSRSTRAWRPGPGAERRGMRPPRLRQHHRPSRLVTRPRRRAGGSGGRRPDRVGHGVPLHLSRQGYTMCGHRDGARRDAA